MASQGTAPRINFVLRRISEISVVVTLCVALLVLIGWTFDLEFLRSLGPGHVPLLPNAALMIGLSSGSVLLLHMSHISHRRRQVALALSIGVVLISGLTLFEYLFNYPLGIDQIIFKHALEQFGSPYPGRVSPQSAGVMFLIGLGVLCIDSYTQRGYCPSESFSFAALTFSILGLLGYAYGADSLFGVGGLSRISLPGGFSYVVLGISLLFARPDRGLMAIVTAPTVGGLIARRLLPAAIIIPILLGWLRIAGEDIGLYNLHEGLSLHVLSTVLLIAGFIWWSARNLNSIDLKRRRSELALEHAYNDLKIAKDQAEAANHAKDKFLAVLSHELRTPLTPIRTTAEILRGDKDIPKELAPFIETIVRNVDLEARLIDDLLDLTRISRGKLELHKEVVDLHQTMHEVIEMCKTDIFDKSLKIQLGLDATRPVVSGDPARMQQVLWNLLKNAIKFTPQGGRITVLSSNDERGRIRLEVCDNGIGIDNEVLPRIFEAFEQGERTVTRKYGGLGLGLAITKNIVELHNGFIQASSPGRNQGAQFSVTFPTLDVIPRTVPAKDLAPVASHDGDACTILLVDDHEDSKRVLKTLLERRGYRVLMADCVRAALELGTKEHFDLLISDIGLPDGSGCDVMRELQNRKPVKGIALSGFGMEEDILKSRAAGFEDHLTKPYDFTKLQAVIERIVGGRTLVKS